MASPTTQAPATQQQSSSQHLPSITSLTNGLPPAQRSPDGQSSAEARDSGTWPQPHSKHTSANSGLHVSTLLNPDDSPKHQSIPSTPLSARVPHSAQSSAGMFPSINQGFQEAGNRDSHASMDSRRSSVDSRMHSGFNSLYINNPASPYESANTSQVSLAASLRRPNGGPMSPMSARSSLRGVPSGPRIAPPIMPGRTPGQPDPTAAKPTQGYAWAFPDTVPEERRDSDSGDSSIGGGLSRKGSLAASVRSSIFSNDSQMPMGQRRFDDEHATTHHHTMQHRAIHNLQNESIPQSIGNYSRTPELRVSHKLAERKRRSEMKDLFEELNKAVPSNGGAKASKWEILTKAIDHLRNSAAQEHRLAMEVERLRKENDYARDAARENSLLQTEIRVMHEHLRRLEPNNTHIYGTYSSHLSQNQGQPQGPPGQANGSSGINLPPLNPPASSGSQQHPSYSGGAPGAMQGVEYGYGQAR